VLEHLTVVDHYAWAICISHAYIVQCIYC